MKKDYSKYQIFDFLLDEYFVESMLHPTPESEAFWKELLDSTGKVNVDLFLSSFVALKDLRDQEPDVPDNRVDFVWERITKTIRKSKRIRLFRRISVAAGIAVSIAAVILILFTLTGRLISNKDVRIADFAKENSIHKHQANGAIQLISGDQTWEMDGFQAEIEHDTDNKLTINSQSVDPVPSTEDTKQTSTYNELIVPYGKRAFLRLPDSTSIWLNTGTKVIYPSFFAKDKREIYVEGEIYAEVAHEENRPFLIKTEQIDVRVLGTVLNVTAYKEDNRIDIVLVSGSVDVKTEDGMSTVMQPNQLFSITDAASTLATVNSENYISWREGIYIFASEPVENILLRLARYYNVTMKIPTNPCGILCSGKLELKDDLAQILEGLMEIAPMNFGVSEDEEYWISFQQTDDK
ncbi:MAG: FecR family protein [Tannerella sp.]|jgi:hypothetical protein|nr:FecR family protein [Tannerella sp.]